MLRRLLNVFRPTRLDADILEELEFHRSQTRGSFGNLTRIREQTRDASTVVWLESFIQDVRYGLRQLAGPRPVRGRGPLAGARHRRKHGDLFPDERGAPARAAGRRSGNARPARQDGSARQSRGLLVSVFAAPPGGGEVLLWHVVHDPAGTFRDRRERNRAHRHIGKRVGELLRRARADAAAGRFFVAAEDHPGRPTLRSSATAIGGAGSRSTPARSAERSKGTASR